MFADIRPDTIHAGYYYIDMPAYMLYSFIDAATYCFHCYMPIRITFDVATLRHWYWADVIFIITATLPATPYISPQPFRLSIFFWCYAADTPHFSPCCFRHMPVIAITLQYFTFRYFLQLAITPPRVIDCHFSSIRHWCHAIFISHCTQYCHYADGHCCQMAISLFLYASLILADAVISICHCITPLMIAIAINRLAIASITILHMASARWCHCWLADIFWYWLLATTPCHTLLPHIAARLMSFHCWLPHYAEAACHYFVFVLIHCCHFDYASLISCHYYHYTHYYALFSFIFHIIFFHLLYWSFSFHFFHILIIFSWAIFSLSLITLTYYISILFIA